jgi:hypothetical protein
LPTFVEAVEAVASSLTMALAPTVATALVVTTLLWVLLLLLPHLVVCAVVAVAVTEETVLVEVVSPLSYSLVTNQ